MRKIGTAQTPAGESIELTVEGGYHVVRVNGVPLMSSAMYGSEQAMATLGAHAIGDRRGARVLVGGLGMGFSLRAALDAFGPTAQVVVAELIPAIVEFHRSELGGLAGQPLDDPRVTLFQGNVGDARSLGLWDAILVDVDNGPAAFTDPGNESLYSSKGIRKWMGSLRAAGVVVIWSAFPCPEFERRVSRLGFVVETHRVRARANNKGPRHTLFLLRDRH